MSRMIFVFVHGAGGWGSYDAIDRFLPYWGMFTGSLIDYLNQKGFACVSASVSPNGSPWVRACELFAEIAGRRVDYGVHYSETMHTGRFGADYTDRALIKDWSDDVKLVLIGHSMGGTTVRLLAHLLAYGDEEEQNHTEPEGLSDLFKGGYGSRIHTIVTLASPSNGASSLDMLNDPEFDVSKVKVPLWSRVTLYLLSLRLNTGRKRKKGEAPKERISNIDRTLAQNEKIATLPHVYYFSIPCCSTAEQEDGTHKPVRGKTEILYYARAMQIGAYQGKTPDGFAVDKNWRANDGLVNTVSAKAPLYAPQKTFDRSCIEKGIWNIMPVFDGDHMSVQGGFFHRRDMRAWYLNLLEMIRRLPE